jgi:amino acid permease
MSTTKYDAMFAMVNMLLGTGPLILPSPCQQAGIILSVGWICIIGFISLNSAEFLVEAMARVNYIKREKKKELERSLLTEDNTENSELVDQTLQIEEPIEIGEMASILSGRKAEIFATIILTLYLLGVIISKCIMTGILFSILGNTLSVVFDGIPVLDSIYIWLGVFFVSGSVFSFRNVSQTKILQFIIIIVRFLSVLAMIVGAI